MSNSTWARLRNTSLSVGSLYFPFKHHLQETLTFGPNKVMFKTTKSSLAQWMAQTKSPNFAFATKMVFPKSLKLMNSGSENGICPSAFLAGLPFAAPGSPRRVPGPPGARSACTKIGPSDFSAQKTGASSIWLGQHQ